MAGVLQHLRSSTLNKRPNPASMVDGQLAINYASGSPGAYFKDSNGNLVKVGPVHVGSGAPNASPASGGTAGNSLGEQWLDTSGGTYVFKIWDGSAWRSEAGEFVNVTGDTMTGALGVIAGDASTPGLFFSGDANTGLYSPGADQVAISTNGTGRLYIAADGKIGVGVSSPNFSASIYGATNSYSQYINALSGSTSGDGFLVGLDEAGSAVLRYRESGSLIFYTSDTERLRITSTGLVGIGTSSPQVLLDITDTGNQPKLRLSTNTASNFLEISRSSSTGHYTFASEENGSSIIFATDPDGTGAQNRVTIDRYGKVGIGSTAPADKLSVAGSSSADFRALTLRNSNGATGSAAVLTFEASSGTEGDTGAIASQIKGVRDNVGTAGGLEFWTSNSGTPYQRARIDSSGRLLVGTSSARQSSGGLQVESTAGNSFVTITRNDSGPNAPQLSLQKSRGTANGQFTVVNSNDQLGQINFKGADGTADITAAQILSEVDGTPGTNDMPGRLVFSTTADGASSPTERMRISNTGTVLTYSTDDCISARASQGAGTSYFFYRGMQGASSTTAGGTTSFIVYTNGNVQNTNNSYAGISDLRLKENIVDATSQWADIKALQVRKYNFREETGQQTHTQIGLIAQEVELVSPGLVSESPDRDEDGNDLGTVTKSVNYSVLYMKAVKALQEAMERIETLEAAVATLQGS
jgi:hypothetical protein